MSAPGAAIDAGATPGLGRLAGLSWAHFLNDGAANYLPGILPALLPTLGVPVTMAGAIMAALLMGQALQPVTGWFADRLGGRTFVLIGLGGSSLGAIGIGLAPNAAVLVTVLVILGLANSCFHPQAMAMTRRLAGNHHGEAMSVFLVGGEIGRGLWPTIASGVVVGLGLKWVWLLGLPGLATALVLARWTPSMPRRHADAAPIAWRSHLAPLTNLVAYSALRGVMIVGVITFVPLLWREQGGSLVEGAGFITVMLVVGVIGNLGGGFLADHLGRNRVIVWASAISAALLAAFLLSSGWLLWLWLALLGISLFATLPLTVLIGQDIFPENRSMGSGIALGFANALGALGVMLLGFAIAWLGVRDVLWLTAGAGAIAFLLSLWLPRTAA